MYREFSVKPLAGRLVQKAYPFAAALGLFSLETWRRFIEGYASENGGGASRLDSGAIAATNPHGYVCGVLFYRVNRESPNGAALVCDPFLVADLPRYAAPVRALVEEADRIACRSDCNWIRIVLPATGAPVSAGGTGCESALFRVGYALESLNFQRRPRRRDRASRNRYGSAPRFAPAGTTRQTPH